MLPNAERADTCSSGHPPGVAVGDLATSYGAVVALDGPTTGLDPESRLWLWETVRELVAAGDVLSSVAWSAGLLAGVACALGANDIEALRVQVAERLGPTDILAAFAGGNGMPVDSRSETASHRRQILEWDLTSSFLAGSLGLFPAPAHLPTR